MSEQELIIWKAKYKTNVEMKRQVAQGKQLIDFCADEIGCATCAVVSKL